MRYRRTFKRRRFARRGRPYRRRNVFRRGLRRFARRRRSILTSRIKGGRAVSNRTQVKLISYGVGSAKAAAGTLAFVMHFSGNDLVTPDVDSACNVITMGQGLGRDQWFNFYKYAYVGGSKLSIRINNITGVTAGATAGILPVSICVFPHNLVENGAYTAANVSNLPPSTQPWARSKVVSSWTGQANGKLTAYCSTKKILSKKPDLDDTFNLQTATTAPTDTWQWVVSWFPLAGTVNIAECEFEIKMKYYVTFLNRTLLAKS